MKPFGQNGARYLCSLVILAAPAQAVPCCERGKPPCVLLIHQGHAPNASYLKD